MSRAVKTARAFRNKYLNIKLTYGHFHLYRHFLCCHISFMIITPSLSKPIWHYRQNSPFPQEQAGWVALKFGELNSLSDVYGGPPEFRQNFSRNALEMFPESRHSIVLWNASGPKAQCILSPLWERDQSLMEACTEYEICLTIMLHNSWGCHLEKFGRFFGGR